MAYSAAQIIQWMKISQPLARYGESKRWYNGDKSADLDLDMKLYITRKDIQYALDQNSDADILFTIGNYGLALCGIYLFQAQAQTGGGGSVTPVNPSDMPDKYDFEVSASSFISSGATSKAFPSSWVGFDILFVRNNITQSVVNQGAVYYSWDKTTATLYLYGPAPTNGASQLGELFQIYPQI